MAPFDMRVPWERLPIELHLSIIDHLSQAELSRLIRVNRISCARFQPFLFQRDIRGGKSNAIRWAAQNCISRGRTCARTLSLAVANGGDVNKIYKDKLNGDTATALHFAAAQGSAAFVRLLLEAGASVHICGHDSTLFSSGLYEIPTQLRSTLRRMKWYPLLSPFIKGHEDVVQDLQEAGAPAELAIQREDPETPDSTPPFAVTIHHVLALKRHKNAESQDYHQFKKYRPSIDSKIPGTGSTALHLSIENSMSLAFDSLIQTGANINVLDTNGRTPLCVAAYLNEHHIESTIKWCQKCVTTLLDKGAKPQGSGNGFRASPLLALTEFLSLKPPGNKILPQLRGLIDLLITHGADVNYRNYTALQNVFRSLAGQRCEGLGMSILPIFQQLLDSGASINFSVPPYHGSVLKIFIVHYNMTPLKLFRIIQEAGAELFPEEVDQVFAYWLRHKKLRDTGFDMSRYKAFVSAGAINDAYNKYLGSNPAIFKLVYENFPVANSHERIVAALLNGPLCEISKAAKLPSSFDPNWIDEQGNSLLHMVVSRAEKSKKTQLPICLANATFLVDKGSSLLHRQNGQTVVSRLHGRKGLDDLAKYLVYRQYLEYLEMADRLK